MQYIRDEINPFSNQALNDMLFAFGEYITSLISEIRLPKFSNELEKKNTQAINTLLNNISDDELEIFTDVNFWIAYQQSKNEKKLKTITLEELKKI